MAAAGALRTVYVYYGVSKLRSAVIKAGIKLSSDNYSSAYAGSQGDAHDVLCSDCASGYKLRICGGVCVVLCIRRYPELAAKYLGGRRICKIQVVGVLYHAGFAVYSSGRPKTDCAYVLHLKTGVLNSQPCSLRTAAYHLIARKLTVCFQLGSGYYPEFFVYYPGSYVCASKVDSNIVAH